MAVIYSGVSFVETLRLAVISPRNVCFLEAMVVEKSQVEGEGGLCG
jgi:hypothetical protein